MKTDSLILIAGVGVAAFFVLKGKGGGGSLLPRSGGSPSPKPSAATAPSVGTNGVAGGYDWVNDIGNYAKTAGKLYESVSGLYDKYFSGSGNDTSDFGGVSDGSEDGYDA